MRKRSRTPEIIEAMSRAQQIAFGPFVFAACVSAKRLGMLKVLGQSGGLTREELAERLHLSPYGVKVLADMLVPAGVLRSEAGKLFLTKVGECLEWDPLTGVNLDFTADVQWQLKHGHTVGLTGNYSLQNIQNCTNSASPHYKKQVAYTPQTSFCMTATWQNPWANLSFTVDGMSHRWATNEHADGTRLAGFVEADASLWREFRINKHVVTAQFAVLNIFDRQYDIVAHYPMPGRSWKLTLTFAL